MPSVAFFSAEVTPLAARFWARARSTSRWLPRDCVRGGVGDRSRAKLAACAGGGAGRGSGDATTHHDCALGRLRVLPPQREFQKERQRTGGARARSGFERAPAGSAPAHSAQHTRKRHSQSHPAPLGTAEATAQGLGGGEGAASQEMAGEAAHIAESDALKAAGNARFKGGPSGGGGERAPWRTAPQPPARLPATRPAAAVVAARLPTPPHPFARTRAEFHYADARELYTQAIALQPDSAVLHSNRAFAAIRLEEFGSAIADATRAIELDATYAKAHYRRADAAFALGHIKDAVRDFRAAARLAPRDPDLRRKVRRPPLARTVRTAMPSQRLIRVRAPLLLCPWQLAEAEKELKRIRFEEALSVPEDTRCVSEEVALDDMAVEDSYAGPRMEGARSCLRARADGRGRGRGGR